MSARWPLSLPAMLRMVSGSAVPGLPKKPPRVGTNTSAISKEADSVANRVIGRNFMNSPTTPGQNTSGRNAASVVAVEEMIGHAIRLAAMA